MPGVQDMIVDFEGMYHIFMRIQDMVRAFLLELDGVPDQHLVREQRSVVGTIQHAVLFTSVQAYKVLDMIVATADRGAYLTTVEKRVRASTAIKRDQAKRVMIEDVKTFLRCYPVSNPAWFGSMEEGFKLS